MIYYVAYTGINQEFLAQKGLKDIGVEVYCPIGRKTVKHARRTETRMFPAFSRYLFIQFDMVAQWEPVKTTDGIIDILRNNWRPVGIPESKINEIKRRELSGEFDIQSKDPEPMKAKILRSFELLKELLEPGKAIQI